MDAYALAHGNAPFYALEKKYGTKLPPIPKHLQKQKQKKMKKNELDGDSQAARPKRRSTAPTVIEAKSGSNISDGDTMTQLAAGTVEGTVTHDPLKHHMEESSSSQLTAPAHLHPQHVSADANGSGHRGHSANGEPSVSLKGIENQSVPLDVISPPATILNDVPRDVEYVSVDPSTNNDGTVIGNQPKNTSSESSGSQSTTPEHRHRRLHPQNVSSDQHDLGHHGHIEPAVLSPPSKPGSSLEALTTTASSTSEISHHPGHPVVHQLQGDTAALPLSEQLQSHPPVVTLPPATIGDDGPRSQAPVLSEADVALKDDRLDSIDPVRHPSNLEIPHRTQHVLPAVALDESHTTRLTGHPRTHLELRGHPNSHAHTPPTLTLMTSDTTSTTLTVTEVRKDKEAVVEIDEQKREQQHHDPAPAQDAPVLYSPISHPIKHDLESQIMAATVTKKKEKPKSAAFNEEEEHKVRSKLQIEFESGEFYKTFERMFGEYRNIYHNKIVAE